MGSLYVVIRHESVFMCVFEFGTAEISIGREPDCGICLPNQRVSRRHAILLKSESDCRVRDLGGRNGTWLNGHPIHSEVTLTQGSDFEIGPYNLTVCFDDVEVIRQMMRMDGSTEGEQDLRSAENDFESDDSPLTHAQHRVCDLIAEGLQEKEVASRLDISTHTVHAHLKAIHRVLGVSTRGELVSVWSTHQHNRKTRRR